MTKTLNFTYVDNSNFFVEGNRASAVAKKTAGADTYVAAMNNHVPDKFWQPDYGKLQAFVCGDRSELGAARIWVSPTPSDTFWEMVTRNGFNVTSYKKNFAGKEKKVDVPIAHQMTKDVYSEKVRKGIGEVTLVAGDKDFVPVIKDFVDIAHMVNVVFWENAALDLGAACSKFISLNPYRAQLTR